MDFTPLRRFMDSLTSWRIPGNSVSVWLHGKEVFSYQSGFSDVQQHVPMCGDELFFIFSCSKVTTVTAALQLYEQGYFLLDDPLYDFIPEFRQVRVLEPDGTLRPPIRPITLRHLFTMTAGLTYDAQTAAFRKARSLSDGKMDTMTVIRCLAEDPITFDPGLHWQYSLCHDVLAAVVETVSGMRFQAYVRAHIFQPLGMSDSFYHPEGLEDRIAPLYHFRNSNETHPADLQRADTAVNQADGVLLNVGKRNPDIYGSAYDSGGSGIITTVQDYAKLCAALSCGGKSRQTGERILSPGTVSLLHTNQLTEAQRATMDWPQLSGYGYGLGVRTMEDLALSGSNGTNAEFGWGGAAGATVLVDDEREIGMFYTHHMLNPQESYYQPRLRNVLYACFAKEDFAG